MSLNTLQLEIEKTPAAEVADLFLSPYVSADLLCEATQEPGPAMWIVNRSDVLDKTLESLSRHSQQNIAERAKEKLLLRRSSLQLLSPPLLNTTLEDIPEWEVEDVLGHPLVAFSSILFFAKSLNEEHRASSALSLMRRLLEHAPNWNLDPNGKSLKHNLEEVFSRMLFEEHSHYVRSYVARIPLLSESTVVEALRKETHPYVAARLLQNAACPQQSLLEKTFTQHDAHTLFFNRVKVLDSRISTAQRKAFLGADYADPLLQNFNEWYLHS